MKLYKFRSLGTCQDLERAQDILETGKFWCSRFWELNDPMEGVYWFEPDRFDDDLINKLYQAKSNYVICSFSGETALVDPIMWGYYANGFKGIAIEIEVESNATDIKEVQYVCQSPVMNSSECTDDAVEKILTTKLGFWKHEKEYRYLYRHENTGLQTIGKITGVYYGNPYEGTKNSKVVRSHSTIRRYRCRVRSLKETAKSNGIDCHAFDKVPASACDRTANASSGPRPIQPQ